MAEKKWRGETRAHFRISVVGRNDEEGDRHVSWIVVVESTFDKKKDVALTFFMLWRSSWTDRLDESMWLSREHTLWLTIATISCSTFTSLNTLGYKARQQETDFSSLSFHLY